MTLGIVVAFSMVHIVMIGCTLLAQWLGGEASTFSGAAASTPLASLIGDASEYAAGSLDRSTFEEVTNQMFGPVRTFYGLFSFEYSWLAGDGLMGLIGTLLSMAGHLIAAWMIFQVARAAVGGFLSFFGR